MGGGVVGLEPDRLAVFGDRLLQLPLVMQINGEVVVINGVGHMLPPIHGPESHQDDRGDGRDCQSERRPARAGHSPGRGRRKREILALATLRVSQDAARAETRCVVGRDWRTAPRASRTVCIGHGVGLRRRNSGLSRCPLGYDITSLVDDGRAAQRPSRSTLPAAIPTAHRERRDPDQRAGPGWLPASIIRRPSDQRDRSGPECLLVYRKRLTCRDERKSSKRAAGRPSDWESAW